MRTWVLLLFTASGASGLIAEVAVSRALGVALGSDAIALSFVLAAFMGGLAIGAALASRAAAAGLAPRRALRAYALLELAVAALIPALVKLAPQLHGFAPGVALPLAGALLLLPTTAMGATFPLVVTALQRDATARRDALPALLYALNTAGAVAGALVAAHLLLPARGTFGTALAATLLSGLAGGGALLAARFGRWSPGPAEAPAPDASAGVERSAPLAAGLAGAALLGGAAGLGLEVVFTRVLSMVMGGTVYALAAMLSAFLGGIALGSLLVSRLSARWSATAARGVAAAAFLGSGAAAFGVGWALPELPWAFVRLYREVGPSAALETALSVAVLILPAFGSGAAFAALLRAARSGGGASAGRLYAWNTAGSVAGALGVGLLVVPRLGLAGALVACAGAYAVAGALAKPGALTGALALAAVTAFVGFAPSLPPSQLATGAYGYVAGLGAAVDRAAFHEQFEGGRIELVFHEDGRQASVTVERFPHVNTVYLKTDGKVEGSAPIDPAQASTADMATQVSLAALPASTIAAPRRALVIGLGGGMTVGAAAAFPFERIDIAEIEPAVARGVRASAALTRAMNGALDDPRVVLLEADARRVLARAAPGTYDLVISQPSEPWRPGSASLFTVEHFEAARRALRPGGRFCQWVQLYGLDAEGLGIVLATFRSVFPEVWVARPRGATRYVGAHELLLVGSAAPLATTLREARARLAPAQSLLAREGLWPPAELLGQWVADPLAVARLAAGARVSTDDRNVIAFRAPATRYLPPSEAEARYDEVVAATAALHPFGAIAPVEALALARGALRAGNAGPAEGLAREALAAAADEPGAEVLAEASVFFEELGAAAKARGRRDEALLAWIEALRLAPDNQRALQRVMRLRAELLSR